MSKHQPTADIPKNPAVRRAWIVYQLRIRGTSLRCLARNHDVTHQAMSNALMLSSARLQTVIAEAIGLTPQQLFPEFYDGTGNRLSWTRETKRTTRRDGGNVENKEVA